MTPSKSNLNKESCSPISSNCIIWQGPDLSCINLCTGDSVSDVIYNLAVEICKIKDELNLEDVDLKCLIDNCALCPDPQKTLEVVLQLLIDKVCTLQELIDAIVNPSNEELTVRLAQCFYDTFTDGNGDLTNPVKISDYVSAIAQKVCSLISKVEGLEDDVVSLQDQLDNHEVRITDLENEGELQVTLTCTGTSPAPVDIDVAVEQIEQAFCSLKSATGEPSDLLDVISKECQPATGSTNVLKLTDPNSALWSTTVQSQNIADTMVRMWAAICDLRGAVKLIQDNCCKVTCDDVLIDFDVKWVSGSEIKLFFGSKSFLPTGFVDYKVLGNKFTFTDTAGHVWDKYIKLYEEVFNDPDVLSDGYGPIDLDNTAIDTSLGFTIKSDITLWNPDSGVVCVKCLEVVVPAPPETCCKICVDSDNVNDYIVIYYYE